MKVAIYTRENAQYQINRDSSLFQLQELTNYAKHVLNTEEYEVFEDVGYSGNNTDRPSYQNMMARIREKEFTHLIVWKIDRISRNLNDFTEMCEEHRSANVEFVAIDEQIDSRATPIDATIMSILSGKFI